jgi:hypothetical protein
VRPASGAEACRRPVRIDLALACPDHEHRLCDVLTARCQARPPPAAGGIDQVNVPPAPGRRKSSRSPRPLGGAGKIVAACLIRWDKYMPGGHCHLKNPCELTRPYDADLRERVQVDRPPPAHRNNSSSPSVPPFARIRARPPAIQSIHGLPYGARMSVARIMSGLPKGLQARDWKRKKSQQHAAMSACGPDDLACSPSHAAWRSRALQTTRTHSVLSPTDKSWRRSVLQDTLRRVDLERGNELTRASAQA